MLLALAAAAGAQDGGGMPQFNPAHFVPQLFWLAVSFVTLYMLLSRIALPRIGQVIEERQDRIRRDLDEASRMKSDTEKALASYEKSIADARSRAQAHAKEARDRVAQSSDKERAALESRLGAKIAETEKRIATMKTAATASISAIAAETAGPIVRKLIGVDPSADEIRRALQPAAGE